MMSLMMLLMLLVQLMLMSQQLITVCVRAAWLIVSKVQFG